jgi:hypothetical protein
MEFLARCEVNVAHLVDDITKQVATLHPVIHALEYGRDYISPVVAIRA